MGEGLYKFTTYHTHTHTHAYIYIYIYIYIQILLNIIDIFCLHIFLLILSDCCIDFIVFDGNWLIYFPSTFCPTLGLHLRRMYYKSNVTFLCILLLCKKKSIWAVAVCSVYFYIQRLHHFCNTSSPDDGPKSDRKYLGNKKIIENISINSRRIL